MLALWLLGPGANARLRIDQMSAALRQSIPDRFVDLIEIAAYVYFADQAVTRGGAGVDNLGLGWRRRMTFCLPVRDLEFWQAPEVGKALASTLGFLSEDHYTFEFAEMRDPPSAQGYFNFTQTDWPAIDEVVLFSGGLDSLGGVVQESVVDRRRIAVVTHRPTVKLRDRHQTLARLIDEKAGDLPCPSCNAWVGPECQHLTGWQGAETQAAARELASFACPSGGSCWDDQQRVKANLGAKVVHEGQTIKVEGKVIGSAPATDTLGFRWSGVHNLFLTAGDLAADE